MRLLHSRSSRAWVSPLLPSLLVLEAEAETQAEADADAGGGEGMNCLKTRGGEQGGR